MYFTFKKPTKDDIEILIQFKLDTIIDKDNNSDENELNKIMDYVEKSTNEHLSDYQLIIVSDNITGSLLIYPYEDGLILDEIYLKEEYRNLGIGSKILSQIINDKKIYLWVYKNNSKALSLYQKFNFKIIEETETRYKMMHEKTIP